MQASRSAERSASTSLELVTTNIDFNYCTSRLSLLLTLLALSTVNGWVLLPSSPIHRLGVIVLSFSFLFLSFSLNYKRYVDELARLDFLPISIAPNTIPAQKHVAESRRLREEKMGKIGFGGAKKDKKEKKKKHKSKSKSKHKKKKGKHKKKSKYSSSDDSGSSSDDSYDSEAEEERRRRKKDKKKEKKKKRKHTSSSSGSGSESDSEPDDKKEKRMRKDDEAESGSGAAGPGSGGAVAGADAGGGGGATA